VQFSFKFPLYVSHVDDAGEARHSRILLARSRGFLEDLADAARYRLGTFSGHLVGKRCQLLALFAQHLELLVRMRRPKLDDIRWRLGRCNLLREIENRLDVSPSHVDHPEVKGTDVFQRDGTALFNCSGRLLDRRKSLVGSRSAFIDELLALIVFGHRTHT